MIDNIKNKNNIRNKSSVNKKVNDKANKHNDKHKKNHNKNNNNFINTLYDILKGKYIFLIGNKKILIVIYVKLFQKKLIQNYY